MRRRKAAAASLPISSCCLAPQPPDGCECADVNRSCCDQETKYFLAACVAFSTSAVAEEGGSLRDVHERARESRDHRRQQEPSEAEVRDVELTGLTGQTPSAGCLFLTPAVAISSHTEERWFCRKPLCPHSLCLFHAFWSGCAGLLRFLCLFSLMDIFFVSLRASEARGLEQRLKESRDAISESCWFSGNPITLRRCENVLLCTSFPSSKLYC